MRTNLTCYSENLRGCCGITEVYDLNTEDADRYFSETKACIATTIAEQRREISALKRLGFKAVKRFKNPETGNNVTLWYRGPRRG